MSLPTITTTTERKPPRIVVHGMPGVGKTTLAAAAPAPIFLRTEDGQEGMGVQAFDLLTSWPQMVEQLSALIKEEHNFRTVVVDALDGVERLILAHVCAQEGAASIEKIPYGKGYVMALDQWQRLFAALQMLREKRGMAAVLICHSIVKRHASPDLAEFDRYQMRLHDKAQGLVFEWADLVGFARTETLVKETDSGRAQGVGTGRRLLCCNNDAPAYVGKNRYGVNQPLLLTWSALDAAVNPAQAAKKAT